MLRLFAPQTDDTPSNDTDGPSAAPFTTPTPAPRRNPLYLDSPTALPTPEEIADLCRVIRCEWSTEERMRRRMGGNAASVTDAADTAAGVFRWPAYRDAEAARPAMLAILPGPA